MTPHPPPPLVLRLRADESAPAHARRGLTGLDLRPEVRDDAAIVLSELVANSVLHGPGGDIVVRAEVGATLRLEVRDDGRCFEPPPAAMPLDGREGGRGLRLVEVLAERWGVEGGDGCHVWAELAM